MLPIDYAERVYAGVLGKTIGVYLGRPFENWKYRDILSKLGPINYYVHERRNAPLVVADDDLSGTFTFIRAMEDFPDAGADITPAQIGQTWLNYIIENRTILWWGGLGLSSEHTAFLRMKQAVMPPYSGSIELNGRIVAEQIGAQIFVDGWAMLAPGQPDLAVRLARRAGSVSHDGEALHAAGVIAAMESQAFVEPKLDRLLDIGVSFIPDDSIIYRMIDDLRSFRVKNGDWNKAMTDVMEARYGYDKYGGNCHVVPNHGLIILALLWGEDDFQKSLMIANTCGWDTDCNSGNVGCLLGIKRGLAGINAGPDWRSPVADRLLLPTADGGSCISDAATVAQRIVNLGRRLAGQISEQPKNGAKFHFSFPGSVQGFVAEDSIESRDVADVSNDAGKLVIHYRKLSAGRVARVATATFLAPAQLRATGYGLQACPTMYSSQQVRASLSAAASNDQPVHVRYFIRFYGPLDELVRVYGQEHAMEPGRSCQMEWTVPDTGGGSIAELGVEIGGEYGASGAVMVDRLTWEGTPTLTFGRLRDQTTWRRAWIDAVSSVSSQEPDEPFRLVQNVGRGLFYQGTRDWTDYAVTTHVRPYLVSGWGLAARIHGLRRYYALFLTKSGANARQSVVQILKVYDDREIVLAETEFAWSCGAERYAVELQVKGNTLAALVNGRRLLESLDADRVIENGAAGFVVQDGRISAEAMSIRPLES